LRVSGLSTAHATESDGKQQHVHTRRRIVWRPVRP
jgi:hypothetical protein